MCSYKQMVHSQYSLSTQNGTYFCPCKHVFEEFNLAMRTAKTAAVSNFYLVQPASELLPAPENSSKIL